MNNQKAYIGDGVYAQFDGERLILTTENGLDETNRIFIEPEVWVALLTYVRGLPVATTPTD